MMWAKHSPVAAIWAAAMFLIDQASKWFLVALVDLDDAGTWPVTSFFSLTMAWNEGISYSLFATHKQGWLIALSLCLVAFLWVWVVKATNRLQAVSLGLIIGGALGNVFDRAWHGAVADFMHFHLPAQWGNWSWYIFNFADVGIVAGVGLLLYDSFTEGRASKRLGNA